MSVAFIALCINFMSGSLAVAAQPLTIIAADSNTSTQVACDTLSQVGTNQDCSNGQSVINKVANSVVKLVSYVAGVAAIVMVMVAGFQFITANGDSNNIARARRSLTYAIVGIVIAVVAQLIVNTVLTASTVCPYNSNVSINDSACAAPSQDVTPKQKPVTR